MARLRKSILFGVGLVGVLLGVVFGVVLGSHPQPDYCDEFRILSGGERLISTFRWTPISFADEYKINLYGSDGDIVASRWFKAPTTNVDLNMGDFGTGPSFQWEVEALYQGKMVCYTDRTGLGLKPGDPSPARSVVPAPIATEQVR